MPEDYVAKAGDCLTSIAFEHGFDWKTLWNHPNNAKEASVKPTFAICFPHASQHQETRSAYSFKAS